MIRSLPYFLAAIALFLLLGLSRVWQRGKHQRGTRSQRSMSDTEKSEILEEGSCLNRDQSQERSLEVDEVFHTFFPSPSHVDNDEAYFSDVPKFSVTSGDLAAMVQQRREQDISISKMHPKPNPKSSDHCGSLSLLQSDGSIRNPRLPEKELIEFYHDPELGKIWRRRLLAFLGQ